RVADAPRALAARTAARISFVGGAILLSVFHWWIALAVLLTGLWLQGQLVKSLMSAVQAQMGQAMAQRRSAYLRELALQPPPAKEIRVFGLGGWLTARYWEAFGRALDVMRGERATGRRPRVLATFAMCVVVTGTVL